MRRNTDKLIYGLEGITSLLPYNMNYFPQNYVIQIPILIEFETWGLFMSAVASKAVNNESQLT